MSKSLSHDADLQQRFLDALNRQGGVSNLQEILGGIARADQVYGAGLITHDMVRAACCLRVAGAITIEYDLKNRVDVITAKKK